MCSSPKPKKNVSGYKSASASFISNLSPSARSRFTERANLAQTRRDKINAKTTKLNSISAIQRKSSNRNTSKNLSYWLLDASLKDIFNALCKS